jgi:hypothetical protein
MTFSDKNTIMNVILMICIFNIVLLTSTLFYADHITGDVILTGSINSGETFEGSSLFIENNDITFSFRTRVTGSDVRRELLNITIKTPEGIEFSWQKMFGCQIFSGRNGVPIYDQIFGTTCVDSAMIFTPNSTGIYHIKISDAKFSTNIRLISGMAQLNLVFKGALAISWIGIIFNLFVFKHEIRYSTKKQALIALMISLITTYVAVQYSSI